MDFGHEFRKIVEKTIHIAFDNFKFLDYGFQAIYDYF